MAVLPENEKVIKLDQTDEEGWVDTHHGLAMEQVQEKVVEMTLEEGKSPASLVPTTVPLVGRGEEGAEDSDSDSEPVVDIDEYKEEEDPVSMGHQVL